ncbi:MAG TPA: metallophosphoesterase, partial [Gemmataceae bacterium]|nr:metallophosphoesterase [Gemmataceae bacterium]
WGWIVLAYAALCVVFGGAVFPFITVSRLLRKPPTAVVSERTQTLDLWPELGSKLHGDGKWSWLPRLPFTCAYRVDFTELTLAPPNLPPEWDGLSILLLSDLHLHGTPSRVYFDRVTDEIASRWPTPDLVCLAGDYVDTDTHHEWLGPLLGRLEAREAKLAILGNHDEHHHPEQLREVVAAAGYTVLGNGWQEVTIRGVRCVAVGHEGPWFTPPPELTAASPGLFRLCLSHSPDNFYWGQRNCIDLMLCGHVHGGQVRIPVVGSIFVPSVYGRRFDQGVFEENGTVMVANRGLSGKEPLRFRCHPQVLRITLTRRSQ